MVNKALRHAALFAQLPVKFIFQVYFYSAPLGERSVVMGLSLCVSVREHTSYGWTDLHDFLCMSPEAVVRFVSGGMTICYVLPVCGWRHVSP